MSKEPKFEQWIIASVAPVVAWILQKEDLLAPLLAGIVIALFWILKLGGCNEF